MCKFDLRSLGKLDPFDILGRREDRKKASQANIAASQALTQQQQDIADAAQKKRIARKPIQTILGGAQMPAEGVTLGS